MKKIVIIVLTLILVVGGGFGGLYATDNLALIGLGDAQAKTPDAEVKDEEPPSYIPIEKIIVPVIQQGAIRYQIFLDIQLEVANTSDRLLVRQYLPKLQDAIVVELVTRPVVTTDGLENIDVLAIKSRLIKVIKALPRGDIVRDVLVTQAARGK